MQFVDGVGIDPFFEPAQNCGEEGGGTDELGIFSQWIIVSTRRQGPQSPERE